MVSFDRRSPVRWSSFEKVMDAFHRHMYAIFLEWNYVGVISMLPIARRLNGWNSCGVHSAAYQSVVITPLNSPCSMHILHHCCGVQYALNMENSEDWMSEIDVHSSVLIYVTCDFAASWLGVYYISTLTPRFQSPFKWLYRTSWHVSAFRAWNFLC